MKVKSLSRADAQQPHGLQPTRLLRPWDFAGKSTGVGCHGLLQEEDYTSSNYLDAQIHIETAVNVIQEMFSDLSSSLPGSSMACY